jgi:hypothetical protein
MPLGTGGFVVLQSATHLVREGIIHSLARFGHPRVEETSSGLAVRVGDHEAQNLFAFDRARESKRPSALWSF